MTKPTAADASERPTSVPWPPILISAGIAGGLVLNFAAPLPWPGMDDGSARLIGLGLGGFGLLLLVWAIATLRRHQTTVLPNKAVSVVAMDGPYRFLRNPIYLADVLIFFGLGEVSKNVWFVIAGLVFAVLVTWLAIVPEERHLEAKFGDGYRAYKEKTRRWI